MIDTTHYKKLLTEEHETLKQELNTLGRHFQENPDAWEAVSPGVEPEAEKGDVAMNLEEYAMREALVLELQTRYKEVSDALERINLGTYGMCATSKDPHPIEKERLDADPAACVCIAHTRRG